MLSPGEIGWMRDQQAALMVDTVTIDRLGEPVWDPVSEKTVPSVTEVYSGRGRVAVLHGDPIVTPSGELTTPQQVMVTVPYGAEPAPGDRVTITPRPGLPAEVWVQSVETPGIVATACRMTCGVQS